MSAPPPSGSANNGPAGRPLPPTKTVSGYSVPGEGPSLAISIVTIATS